MRLHNHGADAAAAAGAHVADSNLPPPDDFDASGATRVETSYTVAPFSSVLLSAKGQHAARAWAILLGWGYIGASALGRMAITTLLLLGGNACLL